MTVFAYALFNLQTVGNMPRKFKLGRHQKNGERKKQTAKRPAVLLSPTPLTVSLPLSSFTESPCSSLQSLGRRITDIGGQPNGQLGALCLAHTCTTCMVFFFYTMCMLIVCVHLYVYVHVHIFYASHCHSRVGYYD